MYYKYNSQARFTVSDTQIPIDNERVSWLDFVRQVIGIKGILGPPC